jgi:16S rRNA (guanine527-N7)-methyltransferase
MSETYPIAARLNNLLVEAGLGPLDGAGGKRFEAYLSVLSHWNARVNLTGIRDVEGILSRHFVESIACARALPAGVHTLLDFGSGAGFPGIPIALCRPEVVVTLAESQGKKAAFLREAVRILGLNSVVYSGRAEQIGALFGCVTLRAVEKMEEAVSSAAKIVSPGGYLAVLTTKAEAAKAMAAAGPDFGWNAPIDLPLSRERLLVLGVRQ